MKGRIRFTLSLFQRLKYQKMADWEGVPLETILFRELGEHAGVIRAWKREGADILVRNLETITLRLRIER